MGKLDERGQVMPLALVVVAAGLLLVSPFLTRAVTHLVAEREGSANTTAYFANYTADAGVEYALQALKQNLSDNGLGTLEQVLQQYPSAYTLVSGPPPLNGGLTPTVTVQLLNPANWDTTELPKSTFIAGLLPGLWSLGGVAEAAPLGTSPTDNAYWSFEDGETDDWDEFNKEGNKVTDVDWTDDQAYAGEGSLEVTVNLNNSNSKAAVAVDDDEVSGLITAHVMVPSNPNGMQARIFVYDDDDDPHYGSWSGTLPAGTWVTLTYDISGVAWTPETVGIGIKRGSGSTYNGKVYLDSVDFYRTTVALAKSVSPSTVSAGSQVTYTISASNTGSDEAYPSTITDSLPSGFAYVTGSTKVDGDSFANPSISGQLLTWSSLPEIEDDETLVLTFRATTTSTAGTYYNSAGIQGSDFAPSAISNSAPVTTTVPAVSLAITASPTSVYYGDRVTYTVTITNSGSAAANMTTLSATLPSGFAYITSTTRLGGGAFSDPTAVGQSTVWNLSSSLGSGQSITLTYAVTVTAAEGSYTTPMVLYGSNFSAVSGDLDVPITVDAWTGAALALAPAKGPPGFAVAMTGTGFRPGQTVTVTWESTDIGTTSADSGGNFTLNTNVPTSGASAYWGNHTVSASQANIVVPTAAFVVEAKYKILSQSSGQTWMTLVGLSGPSQGGPSADPTMTIYLWKQQ